MIILQAKQGYHQQTSLSPHCHHFHDKFLAHSFCLSSTHHHNNYRLSRNIFPFQIDSHPRTHLHRSLHLQKCSDLGHAFFHFSNPQSKYLPFPFEVCPFPPFYPLSMIHDSYLRYCSDITLRPPEVRSSRLHHIRLDLCISLALYHFSSHLANSH